MNTITPSRRKLLDAALERLALERIAACAIQVPDTDPPLVVAVGPAPAIIDLLQAEAPASPELPDLDRQLFEVEAAKRNINIERSKPFPERYKFEHATFMWDFWQSARRAQPEGEAPNPCAQVPSSVGKILDSVSRLSDVLPLGSAARNVGNLTTLAHGLRAASGWPSKPEGEAPQADQDRRALELANAALIASEPKFPDGWERHERAINATSCALHKPAAQHAENGAQATIKPRRPLDEDNPHGYLESDDDWIANNRHAVIQMMEQAALAAQSQGAQADDSELSDDDKRLVARGMERWRKGIAGECRLPPAGWHCTRTPGHEGPCAAHRAKPEYGPDNPPRLRRPGESVAEYRAAMGWSNPEGDAPQAEQVTLHCSKCHSTTRHKDGTCTECGNAKFMTWAEIVQPNKVHAPAAQQAESGAPAVDAERARLRADQAALVMPMMGPLLDAFVGMAGDARSYLAEESPELLRHLAAINFAMESGVAAQPQGAQAAPTIDLHTAALTSLRDTYAAAFGPLPAELCTNDIDWHIMEIIKGAALAAKAEAPGPDMVGLRSLFDTWFDCQTMYRASAKESMWIGWSAHAERAQQAAAPGALDWINDVVRDVCELPDRDSPAGREDMMLVTVSELHDIIARHAPSAPGTPEALKGGA